MIVVGIDPGTVTAAWAVVNEKEVLAHGYFTLAKHKKHSHIYRALKIADGIRNAMDRVIANYEIDAVQIEDQYVAHSAASTIKIAHSAGVFAHMAYAYYNIEPMFLAPTSIYRVLPFTRKDFKSKSSFQKAVLQYVKETYDVKLDAIDEAFAILIAFAAVDILAEGSSHD